MTPFQFVDRYHLLRVADGKLGLDVSAKLSKYRAGWFQEDIAEADKVLGIIASKFLKLKSAYKLPPEFFIPDATVADTSEPFYPAGIRRAFASRGSPDECVDALRLAVMAGRCKPANAQAYAEKWFGQDCNAFGGNYLGLSPMIAIFAYALGYDGVNLQGSRSLEATRDYLPLPPVQDTNVRMGDAILTYGSKDSRGFRFRHMGIVQGFTVKSLGDKEGDASVGLCDVSIAEWGQAGQSHHKNTKLDRTLVIDVAKWKPKKNAAAWADVLGAIRAEKKFKDKVLVGFLGTDPNGMNAVRLFFDASSLDAIDHRGWHCGTVYGA